MRVLNIAVDSRPLLSPNNGIGRYLTNLLREFATTNSPHRFYLYCERPFELNFPLPDHWTIRTGALRFRGSGTLSWQLMFPQWARQDRIHVFWSPRHQLPLMLPSQCKKVLTVHDVVWKRFPETMSRGVLILERVLVPCSLRIADQVITDSHFSKSEILSFLPEIRSKLDVVYLASSLRADTETLPCPVVRPYFLAVGSYEPRKNLERMLRAYLHYRQGSSGSEPLDLVIAGTGQWGSFDAGRFIAENQLQSCVHLIRGIDDAVLCSLYAHARALVMVSLYEGFGLPLVEAMQWGLPLIASSTSSVSEVAGDAGFIVDPLDIRSIALAFHRIGADGELCSVLSRKSQERGRQFSWQRTASETMDLLTRNV
ncbi:MAG: glycosyltransferase family 4 protein [Acidobacteriota bacterium]